MIDFHVHTFPETISGRVLEKLGKAAGVMPATNGTAQGLSVSMKEAGVTYSVNLPVMTSTEQVLSVNNSLLQSKETWESMGILTFGGMHPDFSDYRGELHRLKESGILGIKLHPAYQRVDLDDIRMKRIIACASELGLITLIHAGIDIGLYEHNYSSVAQILSVLKEVRPEKFVLAHMGNWARWEEVERDLAGAPLFMDTAFSIGPLDAYPNAPSNPYSNIVLEDGAFLRIVKKHGTDRILFATDSPWQPQKRYVERFLNIGLTESEQRMVLGENAAKLLGLPG
ncbi:MAG: amidohydrolase family protein [Lachnospiraceae bacterium]|nr:amidohydrolase family protein [Lachnospiraceae bacterium]